MSVVVYNLDERPAPQSDRDFGLDGCTSNREGFYCTRDEGHSGRHIADGTIGRCADWDDDE